MRRFFIKDELAYKIVISGDDAHHMSHVLRYRLGQEIVVADKNGRVALMKLTEFTTEAVTAELIEYMDANTEAPIELQLIQCLPKADKMEFIVQKAVELGVQVIRPAASANCVVKYDAAKQAARQKKWQKIADEAAKQCGRTMLTEVMPIACLKALLTELPNDAVKIMCYENEADNSLKRLLNNSDSQCYVVLIGPEGGFTPDEAELCQQNGFNAVTLGKRILRTETASLAAVSTVMYEKGDLGG